MFSVFAYKTLLNPSRCYDYEENHTSDTQVRLPDCWWNTLTRRFETFRDMALLIFSRRLGCRLIEQLYGSRGCKNWVMRLCVEPMFRIINNIWIVHSCGNVSFTPGYRLGASIRTNAYRDTNSSLNKEEAISSSQSDYSNSTLGVYRTPLTMQTRSIVEPLRPS